MKAKTKRKMYWIPLFGFAFTMTMSKWVFDSNEVAERLDRHFITMLGALYHAFFLVLLIVLLFPGFYTS